MDRVLKERLVGAAVLVAIGAWLIPWVLDGPEQLTAPESTVLELPAPAAENPPIRTETIVLERRDSPVANDPSGVSETQPAAAAPSTDRPSAPVPAATRAPTASPVVPPAPAASPSLEPAASESAATRWYVQLGAFGERANADRLAARVGTYGYNPDVSGFPASAPTVYRVRVGPEPTRARAEAISSALSAHGFVAQVVFE
jgi:DedD protein